MSSIQTVSGSEISLNQDKVSLENTKFCPISKTKGKRLLQKTLANHVQVKHWNLITEDGFYFCPDKDCEIVYFNNDKKRYFSKEEIRTTVMHKQEIGSENRPACYCKNVLEKTIIEELTVKGCCDSLIDIQEYTGANTGKDCVITNPSGRCCGKELKKIMDWVEDQEFDIDPPLMDQAMSCCNQIVQVTEEVDY